MKRSFFEKLSLKTKLLMTFILLSAATIVALSLVSYSKISASSLDSSKEEMETLRVIAKNRIVDFFEDAQNFTSILSTDRLVEGLFIAYESAFYGTGLSIGKDEKVSGGGYKNLTTLYGEKIQEFLSNYKFSDIHLVSTGGQIIFSAKNQESSYFLGRNLKDGALKEHPIGDCYKRAESDKHKIIMSESVFINEIGDTVAFLCKARIAEFDHPADGIAKGSFMGVLITQISLNAVNSLIEKLMAKERGTTDSAKTYVVGGEDLVVTKRADMKEAIQDKSGVMFLEYEGKSLYSAYALLKLFDKKFIIVSEKEKDVIYRPVYEMVKFIIIIAILIFIISLLVSWWTGNNIVTSLLQITEKLNKSSNNVSQISSNVSEFSTELAKSVTDQASATTETSSSLEELSGMVQNNTQNADATNKLAHQVESVAKKGESSVGELLQSMEQILSFSKNIEHLVSVIGEIGSKTAIIDEIVFQTKLLSFNASVEAERAGEHGRGFAVVAQEVGNLAQMSGKAASEIASIVRASMDNANKIAVENKTIVENGSKTSNDTAKLLNEIRKNASEMAIAVTNILNASKEQSLGINQINEAVIQLDKSNVSNSNKANEAERMSSLLSEETTRLDEVVGELNSIIQGIS